MDDKKLALIKATCLSDAAFDNTVMERVTEYRETVLVPIAGDDTDTINEILTTFEKNLRDDHAGLLADLVVIFDSEFTPEEQKAIHALYESPIWKRFASAAASMQEKVVEASSAWLMRAQQSIQVKVASILDEKVKRKSMTKTEIDDPWSDS